MTDVSTCSKPEPSGRDRRRAPKTSRLIAELPASTPCVLAINKVDRLRNKARLLPLIEAFDEGARVRGIVPISLLDPEGAPRLLARARAARCPTGETAYAEDTLTDRPSSFFVREYVREQVLSRSPAARCRTRSRSRSNASAKPLSSSFASRRRFTSRRSGQRKILVGHGGQNAQGHRHSGAEAPRAAR